MAGFRYCKYCGSKYEYSLTQMLLCQNCGEPTTGIKLKDEQVNQPLFCPRCKSFRTTDGGVCSWCNTPLMTLEEYQQRYKEFRKYYERPKVKPITTTSKKETNIPKCPTCQSTNIEKISDMQKTTGFLMVGIFSKNFGKTYHCKNCDYRW